MSSPTRTMAVAAPLLALSLIGCTVDSGGGPLHRPDTSVDRILGPAIVALADDGRFGTAPSVLVLMHLDPATILAHAPVTIVGQVRTEGIDPPTVALSDAIQAGLREALEGREVSFIGDSPVPPAPGQCDGTAMLGGYFELAVLPAMSVHGDIYLVIARESDGCGGERWSAARMLWEAGGLIGGEWVASEILDGEVTASDTPIEALVEEAIVEILETGAFGRDPLLVLDHLDSATLLAPGRLPDVISREIQADAEPVLSGTLPDTIHTVLAKYGDGRSIELVPAQPEITVMNEFGCGTLDGGATFVRLAIVPGWKPDTQVVVAELWSGCATKWIAAKLEWTGSSWEIETIDGGTVSV